jgi:TRAP-type transport system periplasmic protein
LAHTQHNIHYGLDSLFGLYMHDNRASLTRRSALKKTAVGASSIGIMTTAGCVDDLYGSNGGAGGGEITLASSLAEGHVLVEAAEIFADQIEEETDGDIEVDVVGGGSYGAEDEVAEQARDGVIEMHSGGGVTFNMYAPDYYFFDNPYVIEDLDHLRRIEESDEFEGANEDLRENGDQIQVGSFIYRGLRQFTSNEPVASPEDVEGLDLRLPELDSWIEIWEAIGASGNPVANDELYSALEQGVVDASEGEADQVYTFNLQEVQDYLSLTEHQVQVGGLYANTDYFDNLDEAHQDAIQEVAEEATLEASEQMVEEEEEIIDTLEDEGMEIVSDVDQDAFVERAEPAIEELFESEWEGTRDDWLSI